jgi:quercetin dioxygenase-like cupin family protein
LVIVMAQAEDVILNPRTGQIMRFLQTAASSGGALLQIETVDPPGTGDPEHVHPRQETSAEVLSGALHFLVDGAVRIVRAGEKIVIPANTPHHFWNEGPGDAVAIQEVRPALRTEEFFRTYFNLAREGKLDEDGMPSILQLALLVPEFHEEMRPTSPPWPLLRMLAALLAPVAKLRGYQSSYSGTSPDIDSEHSQEGRLLGTK